MFSHDDTKQLVTRAVTGDAHARDRLFSRHRDRLRRMIAIRMDRRLLPRVDPSDVVQDALVEATRQLNDYLHQPELPFYPWLRHIAWQRLMQLHRRHVGSQKRSVDREWHPQQLPDESACELARRLVSREASPSKQLIQREMVQRVKRAMETLKPEDRDILVMRHLEQLSVEETAAALGIKSNAAKSRHFRALQRLRSKLTET